MGISQSTSKLAFQNIMNYLRLLLFFFVLLAPLQLTSAGGDGTWDGCFSGCKEKKGGFARTIAMIIIHMPTIPNLDDDHGDNQRDDHGNDHDNDDEDDDYDGNDHNQEIPPRLLQDHFV